MDNISLAPLHKIINLDNSYVTIIDLWSEAYKTTKGSLMHLSREVVWRDPKST